MTGKSIYNKIFKKKPRSDNFYWCLFCLYACFSFSNSSLRILFSVLWSYSSPPSIPPRSNKLTSLLTQFDVPFSILLHLFYCSSYAVNHYAKQEWKECKILSCSSKELLNDNQDTNILQWLSDAFTFVFHLLLINLHSKIKMMCWKMTWCLGTVVTFEEDLSSMPNTHMVAHNFSVTLVIWGADTLFWSSWAPDIHMLHICIHTCK